MSEIEEKMVDQIEADDDARVKALVRLSVRTENEYRVHARRLVLLARLMRNRKTVPDVLINLVGQSALYLAEMSVTAKQ